MDAKLLPRVNWMTESTFGDAILPVFNGEIEIGIAAVSEAPLAEDQRIKVFKDNSSNTFDNLLRLNKADIMARHVVTDYTANVVATAKALTIVSGLAAESSEVTEVEEDIEKLPEVSVTADDTSKAMGGLVLGAINHYTSNHTTTGRTLNAATKKYMNTIGFAIKNDHDSSVATRLFYEMAHPASKRILAAVFLNVDAMISDDEKEIYKDLMKLKIDRFLSLRSTGLPAGTRKLGFIYLATKKLTELGIADYFPYREDLKRALNDHRNAWHAKSRAHVGARYYGHIDDAIKIDQNQYEDVFNSLAQLVTTVYPDSALARTPSAQAVTADQVAPSWQAICESGKKVLRKEYALEEVEEKIRATLNIAIDKAVDDFSAQLLDLLKL